MSKWNEPLNPWIWNYKTRDFDFVPLALKRRMDEIDRERTLVCGKPPAANPPELIKLVRVKVLRPFCVEGKVQPIGEVVTISAADARSLAALGKCGDPLQ